MSKTIKYLIAGLILLGGILVFTSYRACDLYDQNSILKGRDIELTKELDKSRLDLFQFQATNSDLLIELELQKQKSTAVIEATTEATEAMKEGLRTVGELKANAENDQALIAEMEIEISKRDELIDKMVFAIEERDKRYFSLSKQYTIAMKELALSGLVIKQQAGVIMVKDIRIIGLEKSLRGARFLSNVKTPIIVALAAGVVYGLVK